MTFLFKIDLVEIESFSCLKQAITRKIIFEAQREGKSPIAWSVIDSVINHFNQFAPTPNQCLRTLVSSRNQRQRFAAVRWVLGGSLSPGRTTLNCGVELWLRRPGGQSCPSLVWQPPHTTFLLCFAVKKRAVQSHLMWSHAWPGWLPWVFFPERVGNPKWHDTPVGGGMQAKASKIVTLCYFLFSIQLIVVKLFRILKIICGGQCPLVEEECGVTHQPQMLEPPLTRWYDWNEVNKYRGSRPGGQSLLRYQPVCLWYHYTERQWTTEVLMSTENSQEQFCLCGSGCDTNAAFRIRVN